MERFTNRKTISELLSVDIHTDKDIKFMCKSMIKHIDESFGWW
uniref:Uncharacterized protein n=1 Tax=Manihot esculenta TaxID=3983 RepID=A0A2C9VMA8_MANES